MTIDSIAERPDRDQGDLGARSNRNGERNAIIIVSLAIIAIAVGYREAIVNIVQQWDSAEYSHGYLIPFVALYIAFQRHGDLRPIPNSGGWVGLLFVLIGLIGSFVGDLATLYVITHYALILTILGLVVMVYGTQALRVFWPAFVYLLFMIPLPDFLYNSLSNQLQLLSSAVGVSIIRWFDITVFLEGNVIDLGVYKLQVAEACSGLRYLFPLMSFGFLCAFLYRGRPWQRLILFLSTIPIAILMNSLRIGIIGVLVEYQGIEAAQGFLHIFEGWVVFLLCLGILIIEALVLHKLSGRTDAFRDAVAPQVPLRDIWSMRFPKNLHPWPLIVACGLIYLAAAGSFLFAGRSEVVPDRLPFLAFPLEIEDWRGQEEGLSSEVLQTLRLDDYLNVNYVSERQGTFVNLYVAYYASQRKGASVHSPQSCIPGGGWEIESITPVRLVGVKSSGAEDMIVNRAVIIKGSSRQLVYYWFQQRGRFTTNEYLVKWYMLNDAITKHRTDGAMVRLVTPLKPGQDPASADAELTRFVAAAEVELMRYIPN